MEKSADAFRTISEVADALKVPQHVLRFWETRFPQIRPLKRGGNRRFYRPDDVELLCSIKTLLYDDGFTIKGVQRILKERGPRAVAGLVRPQGADEARAREPAPAPSAPAPFEGGPAGPREGADEGAGGEGRAMADEIGGSSDLLDRLQAVLFELSECRRILTAVRDGA